MHNLIINKLVYRIFVDDEKYGADISFNKGLNIVFGPNSVGKTSIVTGIIYGLGAEKGLGIFKSMQNPFKPEFYETINGKQIKLSYLILEISNGTQDISIFRYISGSGKDINIAAIKECKADDFPTTKESKKLIISGEGVFGENGFQNYLFNFLGLNQVELPTYDQKFSKLYFENILPLFFVEQRAGWSQIQSRQVTRYNIKDVKKVAFEYLMGLDKFQLHLIEIKKKDIESLIKKNKEELERKEDNLLVLSNGDIFEDILLINTNNIGKTSIHDYIRYLEERYKAESNLVNQISSDNKSYEESNSLLRDAVKRLDFELRKINERIEKINIEVSGYENYLDRIQKNKYKNKQLIKIKEIPTEVNIKTCPVCENKLDFSSESECGLCHSDLKTKISTPEQNLIFLEDEELTFKKVIKQRILDRRKLLEQKTQIHDKINLNEKQLDHQTKTFTGKEFSQLRSRILEVDSIFKDLEKYQRIEVRWTELSPLRLERTRLDLEYKKLKEQISNYKQSVNDITILETIKKHIQSNVRELGLFKSNHNLINNIKLDENDNYSPYLDNFDIYNISSSSDNIRIILSFYLSLLQTSSELNNNNNIKFPNILILDEPKQQNLDSDSLLNCITVIEKISTSNTQVILTTYSEVKEDKKKFQQYIIHEMTNSTDYLLKKIEG